MALTPYPSLATLPEVIANGGKIPASTIDVFAARTVYASSIPGVVLDCNILTGAKIGGGTPTDNAAAINAVLATATATNPVHLIIDGGSAIGRSLLIPQTGHVTISGHGWATGFYILSGSNCHAVTNTAGTDLASHQTWFPGAAPTAIVGSNVTLSNFRIHCNRGTYPNGNCNGGVDGTNGAASSPDARGSQTNSWLLCGLFLNALDNVVLDRLWIYDAPTFHASFYACTRVWADGCRVEAATPGFSGNTDGFHFNGGCSRCLVTRCWFATGDDAVAFNMDEGNGQDGADLVMADCIAEGCQTVLRVYGKNAAARRVEMRNVKATGIRYWAVTLGDDGTAPVSLAEAVHSIAITDCDFQFANAQGFDNCVLSIAADAGSVELTRVRVHEPNRADPMVLMTARVATISRLSIVDCSIYRNSFGNAAAYLLSGDYGTIGELVVDNFHVAEESGQSYADIVELIQLAGTTVGRLSFSGRLKGVGTAIAISSASAVGSVDIPDLVHQSNAGSPSSFTIALGGSAVPVSVGRFRGVNLGGFAGTLATLSGPGVLGSGFSYPDSQMADNTLYLGSDHSNVPCVKVAGTAHTLTLS